MRTLRMFPIALLLLLLLAAAARADDAGAAAAIPRDQVRELPGWPGRPYLIHVPPAYDGRRPFPVVMVLHGGGGNAEAQQGSMCPESDPKCFERLADRLRFIVVYPNGTAGDLGLPNARTWNAGGGANGYACIGMAACAQDVDDVAYFHALLDDLDAALNVDARRVYAIGMSNGGAMSHRLACEMAGRITAIASVAGENQFAAAAPCSPARPVPVLAFHGTGDPFWPYAGGAPETMPGFFALREGGENMASAEESFAGWAGRNACTGSPSISVIADTGNGTSATRFAYNRCNRSRVVLYEIAGGGHTWPRGAQYFPESVVGRIATRLDANAIILGFLRRYAIR
jgi:polyhydroxybutyrate depolymerase